MKALTDSLMLIATRKDSKTVAIATTCFLFLLVFAIYNGKDTLSIFSFHSLPLTKRLSLMETTFFDVKDTFTLGTFLLAVIGSVVGGINLSLGYTYVKLRGEVLVKSGLFSGVSLLIALLGVGCAACGAAFLGVIFSFFGLTGVLGLLPYEGQEIGYLGLLILLIATGILAKKVTAPNVC